MVEESRLNILSKKTLLVLGSDFKVAIGELGQMEADIKVEGAKILSEDMESDVKMYQIRILEIINVYGKGKRYSLDGSPNAKTPKSGFPKNVFSIPESKFPNMDERDMGEKLRVMINFKVVEEMPGYTLLKVNSMFLMPKQDISMRISR